MSEAAPSSVLCRLANLAGVEAAYHDIYGNRHETDAGTMRTILGLLGLPAADDAQAAVTLAGLEEAPWRRPLEPVSVLRRGGDFSVLVTLEEKTPPATLAWRVYLEDGGTRSGEVDGGSLAVCARRRVDDMPRARHALPLPHDLPEGYHRLTVDNALGGPAEARLIIAPDHCHVPDWLAEGERLWGIQAHLYTLYGRDDWGIGDFSHLAALTRGAAGLGADMMGVNPLHALFPGEPEHCSPYSPSSRSFLNPLYLDVTTAPGYADNPAVAAYLARPRVAGLLEQARQARWVDFPAVAVLKERVLGMLHRALPGRPEEADFARFKEEGGERLHRFALFQALHRHFDHCPWWSWPAAYRRPDTPEVAAFASRHAGAVDFRLFLQWLADRQLAAAAAAAREAGMRVGLYGDLAVAADPAGADAWGDQALFITGAHFGAPPDDFNPDGQDWGMPPMSPHVLRQRGYAPLIAMLRANMRHMGALRIDHAMALQHLFWIVEQDDGGRIGAYVSYPMDDLLGVLALESHRNRCMVIGEDLGTVPAGFRDRMGAEASLSYRLMYFQRHDNGLLWRPQAYPALALATCTTHDLYTIAGHWTGRDLEVRAGIGFQGGPEEQAAAHEERVHDRARIIAALTDQELLPPGTTPDDLDAVPLIPALHQFVARTPSCLALANIDDLAAEVDQINIPGSVTEYPNWRRRLRVPVEDILDTPLARRVAAAIRAERG